MMARFAALLAVGAMLFVVRGLVPLDDPLIVVVSPDESVDEAILIDQGIRAGWYTTDPVIREQLVRVLRFAGETGTERELVDKAVALGLVADDPLIRARLVERAKLQLGEVPDPEEWQLDDFLEAHPEQFRTQPVYRLSQTPVGRPVIPGLDAELHLTETQLTRRLGEDFVAAVARMEAGETAVLTSSFGEHEVHLIAVYPPRVPQRTEMPGVVRQHWIEARREQLVEQRIAELRSMYDVVVR